MRQKDVQFVAALEAGIAFSLFRAAVLDGYTEGNVAPLTDDYVQYCLSEGAEMERGLGVLRIHFSCYGMENPVIKRLYSFILLLRQQDVRPHREWLNFKQMHDRLLPIIHAIAWCPVMAGRSFSASQFMKIARQAPMTMNLEQMAGKVC